MRRELPNLDWLRVFSATALTESFALAAVQLGVTPGAVSQRIKVLENFLGLDLFTRHPQGVRLTEVGKRYARQVRPLLDQLTTATREITNTESVRPIRMTLLPSFAQLWLGPRLAQFHRNHENMSVELWADAEIVDLRNSNFDFAIRYGKPPFPGCDYREMLFDELALVASPEIAETSRTDPWGLPIGLPLVVDHYWSGDFDYWLQATGKPKPANLIVQTYSLYSMAVDAVLNGRGFMIGHTALVSDLVAQGKLRYLSDQMISASNQFYLLTKSGAPLSTPADAFVTWMLEQ
jgi:LysR family glycine cleavage system transcriptional activator